MKKYQLSMLTKAKTVFALGVVNVLRVIWFRFSVRFGLNPVRRLRTVVPEVPFFRAGSCSSVATSSYSYQPTSFSYIPVGEGEAPPDWHLNVLTGHRCPNPQRPWHRISDFDSDLGDIKGVWEPSRFDWVLGFAREYRQGHAASLIKLEAWLEHWVANNSPYNGPNWKCGQEASIRVMHLAMAAIILEQFDKPESSLLQLIEVHLRRIAPTIRYAIAQDNNHGTSEAAALFIGGSWLAKHGCPEGRNWQRQGRKWLENRGRRLIEEDGSFSQYSVNYHRVMLDTYSMAELWRRELGLPIFSRCLSDRLQAATAWLGNMVSSNGADTPNLGANDGARLLPLSNSDYRDVRPSVQLASVLFAERRAYKTAGVWDDPLTWLRIDSPWESIDYHSSRCYDNGGYAVLRDNRVMALLRYPRFRFRPSQSDLLHLDFWVGGTNIFRDAGSYSYSCDEPWQSYFPSSEAHNTVQFDDRNSMPRLSRFLFGAWPKATNVTGIKEEEGGQHFSAGYRDWKGASHHRAINLSEGKLLVNDYIERFAKSAVLRWRLAPGEWRWDDGWLIGHGVRLRVEASQPISRCELVEGWESRYYSQKTPLPVLEVQVENSGRLITELRY